MSTMTLEQVRDALRKIEGGERGVFDAHLLAKDAPKAWADAIDAHLREREAAKAGVTDDAIVRFLLAVDDKCASTNRLRPAWADIAVIRPALEAVAPMLASARVPGGFIVVPLLNDEGMEALRSFVSCVEMGEGYTVSEEMMSQLSMHGAVTRGARKGTYWLTDFGRCLLAAAPKRGEG